MLIIDQKKTFPKKPSRRAKRAGKILRCLDPKNKGEHSKMKHFRRASRAAKKMSYFGQNHEKFTFGAQGLSKLIDQKTLFSGKCFFYSYSWRSGKLIIDLKTLFRFRGTCKRARQKVLHQRTLEGGAKWWGRGCRHPPPTHTHNKFL